MDISVGMQNRVGASLDAERTLEVQVSMIVLPKPMMTRPATTKAKESWLEPAAEITAPRKIAIEHAIEPLVWWEDTS